MKKNPSLQGLENAHAYAGSDLNAAYIPTWQIPGLGANPGSPTDAWNVWKAQNYRKPMDDAQGIGKALDAMGASEPGGIRMKETPYGTIGTGDSPIQGLQTAGGVEMPQVTQPHVQMAPQNKEMDLRVRRARMLNQEQPRANFTPNAGGYNPYGG